MPDEHDLGLAHDLRTLLSRRAAAVRRGRARGRHVYATEGYGESVRNLEQTSLAGDMVFSDGWSLQLATVTGSLAEGLTAKLNVPV